MLSGSITLQDVQKLFENLRPGDIKREVKNALDEFYSQTNGFTKSKILNKDGN